MASACFLIVTVASFQEGFSGDLGRDSGTGGYRLVAESAIPLYQDPSTADGRFELGIDPEASALLDEASQVQLGEATGAAVIFGATCGVLEAALRTAIQAFDQMRTREGEHLREDLLAMLYRVEELGSDRKLTIDDARKAVGGGWLAR